MHLIFASVLLLFASQRGLAFMVILAVPFLLIGFIWSLYVIWRRPEHRRRQLGLIALWLAAITIPCAAAEWRAPRIRAEAERVRLEVEAYRTQHQAYPRNLEDIGHDSRLARSEWGILYSAADGVLFLSYRSPYNSFDWYSWKPNTGTWEFHPD